MSGLDQHVGGTEELSQTPPAPKLAAGVRPGSAKLLRTIGVAVVMALAGAWIAATVADRFRIIENVESGPRHRVTRLSIGNATQNSAVAYSLLGATLSLSLAIAAASSLQQISWARIGSLGMASLAIGGVIGGASSYVATPIYFDRLGTADITLSILVHLAIWCALGAAAGLAFGLGCGTRRVVAGAMIGGMTGAAAAALLFDICGAFFPLARTERPLAELAETRLVSAVLLSLFVVLGTVIVALQESRAKVPQLAE